MVDYKDELIALIDLTQDKPLNEIIYEGLRSAIIKGVIPFLTFLSSSPLYE